MTVAGPVDDGHEPRRRYRRRVLVALVVTVHVGLAATVGLPARVRAVVATSCPACFGMREVAPGLYAAAETPAAQREGLVRVTAAARQRVDGFCGGRRTSPTVVACPDEACYERIGGGGERGAAVLDRAVISTGR